MCVTLHVNLIAWNRFILEYNEVLLSIQFKFCDARTMVTIYRHQLPDLNPTMISPRWQSVFFFFFLAVKRRGWVDEITNLKGLLRTAFVAVKAGAHSHRIIARIMRGVLCRRMYALRDCYTEHAHEHARVTAFAFSRWSSLRKNLVLPLFDLLRVNFPELFAHSVSVRAARLA